MNAEILCIGTELLHGDISNTNAQFISQELAKIGIDVHYHTVVGDNPKRMVDAYTLAFSRADIVISTGGLGPTQDDITKEILAEYFDLEMVFDQKSMDHVTQIYSKFRKDMPENNIRQAYFPEGAIILDNPNGTANGCIIKGKNDKIGILMPGPPFEMKPMLKNSIIPYLKGYSNEVVVSKKITVSNIGESAAEMMILDLIEIQTNPTIAPYAGRGKCVFRVTAKAKTEEEGYSMIEPVANELLRRFGDNAFISEEASLEKEAFDTFIEKNITIATAESCTGGLVASKIIEYPGSSKIFLEGFITYSNEAKVNTLGVNQDLIDKYGAVSEQVAIAMAKCAAQKSGAMLGIATTGVAGPGGGTDEKPVGLVYIGVYYDGKTYVKELRANGERSIIRERAAIMAMDCSRRVIVYGKTD